MVDEKFKAAVAQRDMAAVRDGLRNRLLIDHNVSGGMFREYMDYCEQNGLADSLYQAHDKRALPEENTEENFDTLAGQLSTNFSRDRLERVVAIAQAVWRDEQVEKAAQPTSDGASMRGAGGEGRVVGGERILSETPLRKEENAESARHGEWTANRAQTASSGADDESRVVGEERIISVTPLREKEDSGRGQHGERSNTTRHSTGRSGSGDSDVSSGVVAAAVIAVAAAAIIAGIIIFS